MQNVWDVVVVGAGHAGCEAALAAARMGMRTAFITMNLDYVGQLSCNPAIGGLGKGQVTREIDALGGEMAKVTDASGIQFRMLNTGKGPAVQAPRAQVDRKIYRAEMKRRIEATPNLELLQDQVESLLVENDRITGVVGLSGMTYACRAAILTTGTFLRGMVHMGAAHYPAGRAGEPAPQNLSACLMKLGIDVVRLKTCTPPRLNGKTVDLTKLPIHHGDTPPPHFSFSTKWGTTSSPGPMLPQVPCYMAWTNDRVHEIIRADLANAPILSGQMPGAGPRYCPSIEDKIDAFPDVKRHQLFLEPEGLDTSEMYINGLFTSLSSRTQDDLIHAIPGFENAIVTRYGYAIEYDFCPPTQLWPSLESKKIEGLYGAGQINGTSGYEEAAIQGVVAGINAALKIRGEQPVILGRDQAYGGVLIDDLITKGTGEPYRIFSSRVEYRLLLRHGNADRRLMPIGHRVGLIGDEQMRALREKEAAINGLITRLKSVHHGGHTLTEILQRPEMQIRDVLALRPEPSDSHIDEEVLSETQNDVKYEGYIVRQVRQVEKFRKMEDVTLRENIDYMAITHISAEGRQKLHRIRPRSIGQASRISGVSPADISVLLIHLKANRK